MKRIADDFELRVEVREGAVRDDQPLGHLGIVMTPAINGDYWLMRVPVSDKQAVVCFPKFSVCIGIGFQVEEDWNTNLPFQTPADEIYNHIKHNKGDDSIPDERCLSAIKLLQNMIVDAGFGPKRT